MKERPILFTGPMVRAILDGSKTQTRRIAKEFAGRDDLDAILKRFPSQNGCPHGQPGDCLWVRETTHRRPMLNLLTGEPLAPEYDGGAYTVDGVDVLTPEGFDIAWWYSRKSCPSIHMPRWASRILLEITRVRVERLQDLSEADALAEGVEPHDVSQFALHGTSVEERAELHRQAAVGPYSGLWNRINGAGSWDANPWVWVVEFKRVMP
jgi:hypothetical protein